jgi:predicted amino acid dehydrogenase
VIGITDNAHEKGAELVALGDFKKIFSLQFDIGQLLFV